MILNTLTALVTLVSAQVSEPRILTSYRPILEGDSEVCETTD